MVMCAALPCWAAVRSALNRPSSVASLAEASALSARLEKTDTGEAEARRKKLARHAQRAAAVDAGIARAANVMKYSRNG
jgi:hypothetical protein